MIRAKIHRATVTSADLHYEGSLTIDRDLLDAADLKVYEKVAVVNVNNGARFETYAIEGARGERRDQTQWRGRADGAGRGPGHHHGVRRVRGTRAARQTSSRARCSSTKRTG